MTCPHFDKFKLENGLENYDTIYSSFVITTELSVPDYKANLSCFDCESFENNRLMACIHCIYFGCYKEHFSVHASLKTHNIFVEVPSGRVFCCLCKDYIYDSGIDEITKKYEKYNTGYVSWKPTEEECKLIKKHSKKIVKVCPTTSTGMKGIINLGNTCFMNCIVQAFLHTPILRDYFFTDKHKCHSKNPMECLFCLFAKIYQKYYGDEDNSTISLHDILYLVWKSDMNLYGCNQKDAHEFFLSTRNLLHEKSTPDCQSQEPCNCIIDVIFHGNLQSDVVCLNCSNVSTKVDPLWEISLEIPETSSQGGLIECLDNFTKPEPLGPSAKLNCSGCNRSEEVTKQLTFKILPLIIVIQLKRFGYVKGDYEKKCIHVPFPFDLDMSPFLTKSKKKDTPKKSPTVQSDDDSDNRYSLYAVVVHKGTLSAGHYIAYIRRTNKKWFKCDDLSVEPVDTEEVLASEGYLLFYHKTVLVYA